MSKVLWNLLYVNCLRRETLNLKYVFIDVWLLNFPNLDELIMTPDILIILLAESL